MGEKATKLDHREINKIINFLRFQKERNLLRKYKYLLEKSPRNEQEFLKVLGLVPQETVTQFITKGFHNFPQTFHRRSSFTKKRNFYLLISTIFISAMRRDRSTDPTTTIR